MANKEEVQILATDKGTLDALDAKAKKLHKTLRDAADAAGRIAYAKSGGSSAVNMSQQVESEGYRKLRGTVGTGADARDFAKQASGLGGLVRVYATFAANIFAATAAFNALSKAADVTNMVKGLDQLGAASGRNLGSLSKRVVELTDNAVSLQEAMAAVAKTSSSGMSTKNIERLAVVAKNASQALGLNMNDALSRLSRGIVKLEPELLDELGLMTRLDKATQDYARNVGKSVAQLSQFEKQQAFANAVLTEGEDKFGKLALAANPFTKLAATFANVTQKGLELVNKVLGPIAEMLSKSPIGLSAALGGIIGLLLRQAVPALTAWRSQVRQATEDAAQLAAQRSAEFKAFKELSFESNKSPQALALKQSNSELEKQKKLFTDIRTEASTFRDSSNAANILKAYSKGSTSIEAAILAAESRSTNIQKQLDSGKLDQDKLDRQTKLKGIYDKQLEALRQIQRLEKEQADNKKAYDTSSKNVSKLQESILEAREKAANRKATSSRIINNAAEDAAGPGLGTAFSGIGAAISKELSEGTINKSTAALIGFRAGLTAVATSAGLAFSALQGFLGIVGLIAGAVALMVSVFSKNSEATAKFEASLEDTKRALDGVDRTLAAIEKRKGLADLSTTSISAKANTFKELSGSLEQSVSSFIKAEEAAGNIDIILDKLFSVVGKDAQTKLKTIIAESITKAIKLSPTESAKQALLGKLKEILGQNVAQLNVKEISNLLESGKSLGKQGTTIASTLDVFSQSSKIAASNLESLQESLDNATKSSQDFITSLVPGDQMFKFGSSITSVAIELSKIEKASGNAGAALQQLVSDPKKLALFSSEIQNLLIGPEIKGKIDSYNNEIKVLTTKLEELKKFDSEKFKSDTEKENPKQFNSIRGAEKLRELTRRKSEENALERESIGNQLAEVNQRFLQDKSFAEVLNQATQNAFEKGANVISTALGSAAQKAGLIMSKAFSIGLSGPQAAEAERQAVKKESAIQLRQIAVGEQQILAMLKLNTTLEISNLQDKLKTAKPEEKQGIETNIEALRKVSGILNTSDNPAVQAKQIAALVKEATKSGDIVTQKAGQAAIGTSSQLAGLSANRSLISATNKAADITADYKIAIGRSEVEANINQIKLDTQKLEAQRISTLSSQLGLESSILEIQASQLNTSILKAENDKNIALQTAKILATEAMAEKASGDDRKRLEDEVKQLKQVRTLTEEQNAAKLAGSQDITRGLQLKEELSIIRQRLELTNSNNQLVYAQINATQELNQLELERLSQLQLIDGFTKNSLQYSLSAQQAEIAYQEAAARKRVELESKYAEFDKKRASAGESLSGAKLVDALASINSEQSRAVSLIQNEQQALVITRDLTLAKAKAAKLVADEQERINKLLEDQEYRTEKVNSAADSLAKAFGKIGESLGDSLKVFDKMLKADEKYAQEKIKLLERMQDADGANNPENIKKLSQLEERRDREKLDNVAELTSATKKMFGENTAAAKALQALETIIHIQKLANLATEIATNAQLAASQVPGVIGNIFSKVHPLVAVGLVAAVLGAMGKGGSSTIPAGATAEEQQSAQGTGQSYVNGKLQDNGFGVLGDPTAKSKAIQNSLQYIEQYSFETLEYENKMLDALLGIEEYTKAFASAIVRTNGLVNPKTNSAFGTIEDSGSSGFDIGSLLFGSSTSEIIDAGLIISGSFEAIKKGLGDIKQYETIKNTETGGLLGSLFGDSGGVSIETKTKQLVSSMGGKDGVVGTIAKVFQNMEEVLTASAESFARSLNYTADEVANEAKKAGIIIDETFVDNLKISTMGLKGEELVDAITSTIGIELDKAAYKLYPYMESFRDFGESMFETVVRISRDTELVDLSLGTLGITLTKFSNETSEASEETLAALTSAQQKVATLQDQINNSVGFVYNGGRSDNSEEGNYEMLTGAMYATTEQTEALALAYDELRAAEILVSQETNKNTVKNISLYQSLIKAAGGTEKFLEQTRFVEENFLTEAKRVALTIPKVTAELDRLSAKYNNAAIATINTRTGFIELVRGLDLATEAGSELYAELLKLAPGFAAVTKDLEKDTVTYLDGTTDAAEEAAKASDDLANAHKKEVELTARLAELSGDLNAAKKLRRDLELEELNALGSGIVELQKRIWLLEDEKEALERKASAEVRMLNLLGRKTESLAYTRSKELQGLTASEQALLNYVYALEDESELKDKVRTAYDKMSASVNNSVSKLSQAAKAMREFNNSIKLGANSILSPGQKYELAKSIALATAKAATSVAVTDAEIEARDAARQKLPQVANDFLEASKAYFATSDQYISDFNVVSSFMEDIAGALDTAATYEESMLKTTEDMLINLGIIAKETSDFNTLLKEYFTNTTKVNSARDLATQSGSGIAGSARISGATTNDPTLERVVNGQYRSTGGAIGYSDGAIGYVQGVDRTGAYVGTMSQQQLKEYAAGQAIDPRTGMLIPEKARDVLLLANQLGISAYMFNQLLGIPSGSTEKFMLDYFPNVKYYKDGGLALGPSIINEIGPEYVDFKTPGRVYTAEQTAGMFVPNDNSDLIEEIKKLNTQVAELNTIVQQQTQQLVNATFISSDRNAQQISENMKDAANTSDWKVRVAPSLK